MLLRRFIPILILGLGFQSADQATIIERKVKLIIRDPVGKVSEISTRQRLTIYNQKIKVEDLNLGRSIIIRCDTQELHLIDTVSSEYSSIKFTEIAELRKKLISEIKEVKKRVEGTDDSRKLGLLLAAYHDFEVEPPVELKNLSDKHIEVILNKNIQCASFSIDETVPEGKDYFRALTAIHAFHPKVAETLETLNGFPAKGVFRYILITDRVESHEEVLSVKRSGINEQEFEIPQGLKKVTFTGAKEKDAVPRFPKSMDSGTSDDEDSE